MRTYKVARPTEDHIKEMVEKANKVNLKQIDILLQNGYEVGYSTSVKLNKFSGKKGIVKRGNKWAVRVVVNKNVKAISYHKTKPQAEKEYLKLNKVK